MSVPGVVSGAPSMGQAAELAEQFRAVNDEVIAFVQGCSAEQWKLRTREEDWPLAAGGMHIALSHLVITTWLHRLAAGLPMTETLDDFAVMNAYDAHKYATVAPDDVANSLHLCGSAAARFLEGLTDDELAAVGRLSGLGSEWPLRAVVENVLLGHARNHLSSMRAGLDAQKQVPV